MKRAVIFNSPPNGGKDYICDYLADSHYCHKVEFKEKLKELVMSIYDLSSGEHDYYYLRENKETKFDRLGGKSIRECYIEVSEQLIKPFYGRDYFGNIAADRLCDTLLNVFSDGGFIEELLPVAKECSKLIVIRIHKDGCNFSSDSREYITTKGDKTFDGMNVVEYDVFNKGDESFIKEVLNILKSEEML